MDRIHTVVAASPAGEPIRVTCGYCRSEHNYRGGPRTESPSSGSIDSSSGGTTSSASFAASSGGTASSESRRVPVSDRRTGFSVVSERERSAAPIMLPDGSTADLELLLRRIIREEAGVTTVTPADKWRGGTLVLKPGTPGLQEKSWPIETFFHKVVMLRNRLRTLEQQVNASDLPDDAKVKLQAYVSGCYGSLTTFNVLFADEDDQFKGAGGE